jgi:hypothetical protein
MREMRQSGGQPAGPRPNGDYVRPIAELSAAKRIAAPHRHIFYDRRVADIADAIPKLIGYWASEAYVTRSVLAALLGRTRAA